MSPSFDTSDCRCPGCGQCDAAERAARYEEALRLIAAIPAFPSKDIADRALGVGTPDWEPRAKKDWEERKRGGGR